MRNAKCDCTVHVVARKQSVHSDAATPFASPNCPPLRSGGAHLNALGARRHSSHALLSFFVHGSISAASLLCVLCALDERSAPLQLRGT